MITATRRSISKFNEIKRIAVVGGGVAGMQVVDQMNQLGMECTLFDKKPDLGGVWRSNYAEFGLQVPWELYEFPGFRYEGDENAEKFPRGPDVQRYIQRFGESRGIYDSTKFNSKIVGIVKNDSGWDVTYEQNEKATTEKFDFAVICTGMYSLPNKPNFPGADDFKGEIIHAEDFKDGKQAEGKKVVVVGGGKSAIDCAVVAGKNGVSSTLLFRSPHWPVPRYLANLVPFQWATYSRFGHFTLNKYYDVTNPLSILGHAIAKPFKYVYWRIVEQLFKFQFGLSGDRVPKTPVNIDLFSGGQILNYDYRDALKAGTVKDIKGSIDHYSENGIVLKDGTELEADLVVMGTGFTKDYSFFDEETEKNLNYQKDGLYLYRSIIPPRVPNLAFVGAEMSTFNNILTQSLQCLWLKNVMSENVNLPTPDEMQKRMDEEIAWKRSWMPGHHGRAAIFQLHKMKYHDQLCKDMGIPHRRKSNLIAEAFVPYTARDYEGLFKREKPFGAN